MCVDHQRLNLSDGKVESELLAHRLDDVHGCEGCVESEVEPVLVSCLAVPESGELVAVAETELDLEPRVVDVKHVDAPHGGVGGEVEPVRAVPQDMHHESDVPAERLAVGDEPVGLLAIASDGYLLHPAGVEVVEVYLSVVFPGPPLLARAPALVEVIQHRVVAQAADQVEADVPQVIDEGLDRESRIGHDAIRDAPQPRGVLFEHGDVPLVQRHVHRLEFTGRHRLHGTQHHAVTQVGVHQADAQYLQPVLDGRGAARPEAPHMGSLPARLGHVARVYGDGQTAPAVPETVRGQVHVELQPVEPPPEGLAVALLAAPSVAPQLQEIDFSRYGHDQNQYLDDVRFNTFV